MPSVLPLRKSEPAPPRDYYAGWRDGCAYGERLVNARCFWLGVGCGVVLAAVIAFAALYLTGALK